MTDQPGTFTDQLTGPFNQAHANSDVDQDVDSLHHTLGPGNGQAAPGTHDHGLAAYKSYVPRVESGGADYTYNAADIKARYQLIGNPQVAAKTMFLNIHIKAAPTSGPGVFQTNIYLPDRYQMNADTAQIFPCLYVVGSPPAGIANSGLGMCYFDINTNKFYVLVFGGGATAIVSGSNGLTQLIVSAILQVVRI